jgi:16S rRNA processing protein RimM
VRLDRDAPRGAALELPMAELPPAGEGEFYVFQLVGLTAVEEDGRELGRVQDVVPGVANDVLELEGGISLPMVEDCVRAVDLEGGRIVIAPGFTPES